jgi:hypothetical protein
MFTPTSSTTPAASSDRPKSPPPRTRVSLPGLAYASRGGERSHRWPAPILVNPIAALAAYDAERRFFRAKRPKRTPWEAKNDSEPA